VMAAAATEATLRKLAADPPYARMAVHGEALMAGIRRLAASHGLPLRVQGLPMAFHASFGDPEPVWDHRGVLALDAARYAAFAHLLADHGVWVASRGVWMVSAAHSDQELPAALERLDAALKAFTR
jgi:glutamate-1-semialdehyde 2,1-aminomutase